MKLSACLALPFLLLPMLAGPLAAQDDVAKPQQLIDRAIKAIGGTKALNKTRNTILEDEGTYYGMGNGVPYTGRYVTEYGSPGRHRMEIQDAFLSVTAKNQAWISVMGMTIDLDGDALEVAKKGMLVTYATSLIPLQKPNKKFKLSKAEPESVEGEECVGIKIDHEGMPTVTMHFSKKTGLMKKVKHLMKAQELGFKEVTDETIFHEYKKFDGVLHPSKMTIFRDGKKFVESNPKNVTFPKQLDESEFKRPE
ncbi:MAG: hypothetical protein HON53_17105 [Planctomycetaceae bacterium]|jgi:hypothetical protein|nr:hypothetical protein [Planctomycetaceae bacterium]MBT6153926.1 hypothetical protein [Planctomycetaceae bacterium]MBT6483772.1 hypothetical protein [Planctomycetaceae bacterium]MBT6494532.1 hypothetical protein [Planctomycetaceae bacterium]